jgi:hypothetical protein
MAAWLPGAYDLRALSWAHVRVWGAAGRGCHTPASPGSAHFVRSCYVNRALLGKSTSAVACGSASHAATTQKFMGLHNNNLKKMAHDANAIFWLNFKRFGFIFGLPGGFKTGFHTKDKARAVADEGAVAALFRIMDACK